MLLPQQQLLAAASLMLQSQDALHDQEKEVALASIHGSAFVIGLGNGFG